MKKVIKKIFAIFALGGLILPSAIAQAKPLRSSINISGGTNMNDDDIQFINNLVKENPISKEGTFNWKKL